MKNLRGLCYDMEKEYSRTLSRLAIPQLMNEIREAQRAEERFRLTAFGLDTSWTPMGEAEGDNEEQSA